MDNELVNEILREIEEELLKLNKNDALTTEQQSSTLLSRRNASIYSPTTTTCSFRTTLEEPYKDIMDIVKDNLLYCSLCSCRCHQYQH